MRAFPSEHGAFVTPYRALRDGEASRRAWAFSSGAWRVFSSRSGCIFAENAGRRATGLPPCRRLLRATMPARHHADNARNGGWFAARPFAGYAALSNPCKAPSTRKKRAFMPSFMRFSMHKRARKLDDFDFFTALERQRGCRKQRRRAIPAHAQAPSRPAFCGRLRGGAHSARSAKDVSSSRTTLSISAFCALRASFSFSALSREGRSSAVRR